MNDNSKHIKLHIGSMITLRALEKDLDNAKISCLIKNFSENSKTTGFADLYDDNEIYILEEDYESAKEILKIFLKA